MIDDEHYLRRIIDLGGMKSLLKETNSFQQWNSRIYRADLRH
jgi:surfactin synthase thioesterase subunit